MYTNFCGRSLPKVRCISQSFAYLLYPYKRRGMWKCCLNVLVATSLKFLTERLLCKCLRAILSIQLKVTFRSMKMDGSVFVNCADAARTDTFVCWFPAQI